VSKGSEMVSSGSGNSNRKSTSSRAEQQGWSGLSNGGGMVLLWLLL